MSDTQTQSSEPIVIYLDQMIGQQASRRDDLISRGETEEAALVDEDIGRLKAEKTEVLRVTGALVEEAEETFGEVELPAEEAAEAEEAELEKNPSPEFPEEDETETEH